MFTLPSSLLKDIIVLRNIRYFFQGVCGSLTSFFRIKITAKDNLSYSSEPSYIGQTNYDKDYVQPRNELKSINEGLGPEDVEMTPRAGNSKMASVKMSGKKKNINAVLDNLKKMENTNLVNKATVVDISKQVDSQMGKVDQMIDQADRAQTSLSQQNKQMRSYLK